MSILALDIREVPIQLHLGNHPPVAAALFLHQHGPRGREGLLERLNGTEGFIPVRWEGSIHLVGRASISYLETSESPPSDSDELPEVVVEPSYMRLRLRSGQELTGSIRVFLPDNRNRLLDFLNLKDRFFGLSTGAGLAVVNKDWIETAEPLAGEP